MAGSRRASLPQPPTLPPVSSKAKDYSMDRPSEVQNELDQLRNRGLAKVLNKHFTETTKKLAVEKAAADAALADLERRRANTSEFVPSKSGELSPFDSMYVQLQQKRAECRRKEKETILLYQRYVHKYGKNTKITAPTPALSPVSPQELSPSSASLSTHSLIEAPPPPSPSPINAALQPLEEDAEALVSSRVQFANHFNKELGKTRARDPPSKLAEELVTVESLDSLDNQDLAPQESNDSESVSTPAQDPPQSSHAFVTKEIPESPSKMLPKSDPPAAKFIEENSKADTTSTDDLESENVNIGAPVDSSMATPPVQAESVAEEEVEPEQKLQAKQITTETLPTERQEVVSENSDFNRPTLEVTTELPVATEAPDAENDDDRSIISGLTMNSPVTRQVIDEIEQEIDQFLKVETEAIRKQLDEEDKTHPGSFHNSFHNSSSSLLGDETNRASAKAEAMAREMQKILDEYQQENDSGSNPEKGEDNKLKGVSESKEEYPKVYETEDPSEDWMVYYDQSFGREYYFEKNTKRTQWEPPSSQSSRGHLEQPLIVGDVTPAPMKRRLSRAEIFRRRRRKKKIRRLGIAAVVALLVSVTLVHWQQNHSDKSFWGAVLATYNLAADQLSLDALKSKAAPYINHQSLEDKLGIEGKSTQRRKELEEEASRAAKEAAKKKEAERQAALLAQQQAEAREEAIERAKREKEEQEALKRPFACNLPLAYVHPRCNRLAKLNPMYEEKDLIHSFLQ